MCDVLDRVERKGAEEQAKKTAINLFKMGMNPEDIAKALDYSLTVVHQWLGIATA